MPARCIAASQLPRAFRSPPGANTAPGWDDHVTVLARRAEAVASLLTALPRKLHRLVRADGTPVRPSPRQLNAFQAAPVLGHAARPPGRRQGPHAQARELLAGRDIAVVAAFTPAQVAALAAVPAG